MSIGIWTGAPGTTKLVTFGDPLLRTFADRTRAITLTTGPHVKFINMGCQPLFIVPGAVPTTDADALLRGIPVAVDPDEVIAAAPGNYTLYSPYESLTVLYTEGTLS